MRIEIVQPEIAGRRLSLFRIQIDRPESLVRLLDSQQGIAAEIDESRNVVRLRKE